MSSHLESFKKTWDQYWTMHEASVGQTAACGDPECEGYAEQEVDGDHRYMECTTCGFTWGYERVGEASDGTCAIGVPEPIRLAASGEAPRQAESVPVTLTRKIN